MLDKLKLVGAALLFFLALGVVLFLGMISKWFYFLILVVAGAARAYLRVKFRVRF
jgi:hypothetical protein